MAKVTIRGTGQLNGPVIINKVLEMDDAQARNLTGAKRYEVITALLAIHYPGVKIQPNQISVNVDYSKK
jgi:hypothetical protein